MMTAVAVEEKQETVTFYSWMGSEGRAGEEHACPSNQIIRISGGEAYRTSDGGKAKVPVVEARFQKGRFTTSDPTVIAELRRIIRNHPGGLSEDLEEFYAATLTPKQRANRAVALGQKAATERDELIQENRRLRDKLEQAGREEPARRKTA
jgi:hypothetical protein